MIDVLLFGRAGVGEAGAIILLFASAVGSRSGLLSSSSSPVLSKGVVAITKSAENRSFRTSNRMGEPPVEKAAERAVPSASVIIA